MVGLVNFYVHIKLFVVFNRDDLFLFMIKKCSGYSLTQGPDWPDSVLRPCTIITSLEYQFFYTNVSIMTVKLCTVVYFLWFEEVFFF